MCNCNCGERCRDCGCICRCDVRCNHCSRFCRRRRGPECQGSNKVALVTAIMNGEYCGQHNLPVFSINSPIILFYVEKNMALSSCDV